MTYRMTIEYVDGLFITELALTGLSEEDLVSDFQDALRYGDITRITIEKED